MKPSLLLLLPLGFLFGCPTSKPADDSNTTQDSQPDDSTPTDDSAPQNEAPSATITLPDGQTLLYSDHPVALAAMVSDPEDAATALQVQWVDDVDGVLPISATPEADGSSAASVSFSEGNHHLELTVTDTDGATATTSVDFTVNGPNNLPDCMISFPLDGAVYTSGESIEFQGLATDINIPATALTLTWNSDVDGLLGSGSPDANGLSIQNATLSDGNHHITFSVNDEAGGLCTTSIDVRMNQLPTQPTVSISPNPAYTDQDLVATAMSNDPDNSGSLGYQYSWSVDGVPSTASNTATLPASVTTKHETWTVEVIASDDAGSSLMGSSSIVIENSAPVIHSLTTSAATAVVGDTLTCTGIMSDADNDGLTYSFTWTDLNGTVLSNSADWTVQSGELAPGDTALCTLSVEDGDGGVVSQTQSITLDNSPPIISATIDLPSAAVGDTLTCTAVTFDLDGDSPSLDYAWYNNGILISTSSSYTVQAADTTPGDTLNCVATATDAQGGNSSDQVNATIDNSDPTIDSLQLDATVIYVGDTLRCNGSASDPDDDSLSYSYSWYNGTNLLASTNSYTVSASDLAPGDTLRCELLVSDPWGGSDSQSSMIGLDNSAPAITGVSIQGTATTNSSLSCVVNASDANGGTLSYSYAWYVNGTTLVSSTDQYTILESETNPTDSISCHVTVTDSGGLSDSNSASLTVVNAAPTLDTVQISSSNWMVGDTLVCSASASDIDQESLNIAYAWYNGSTLIGSSSSYTITAADTDPGDTLNCQATVNDPQGANDSDVASGTVINSPPSTPVITFNPNYPVALVDDIQCMATATDPDDDTLSYSAAWSFEGTAYTGFTTFFSGDTVPVADHNACEIWTCSVSVSDGRGGSSADSADVESVHAASLSVDGQTSTLNTGTYCYGMVEVINGGRLSIMGEVILSAASIYVDAGSDMYGTGQGYAGGSFSTVGAGTGGGGISTNSGAGGGSYGGIGGTGGYDSGDTPGTGGSTYGTESGTDIAMGSGGGGGVSPSTGGGGGAALVLLSDELVIDGSILMNGAAGVTGGGGRNGGGGAGGGILIEASMVSISGSLEASGGHGGDGTSTANDGGGGGGGGRIKLFYESLDFTGRYLVSGGAGGLYGTAAYGAVGGTGSYYSQSSLP